MLRNSDSVNFCSLRSQYFATYETDLGGMSQVKSCEIPENMKSACTTFDTLPGRLFSREKVAYLLFGLP